MEHPAPVGAAEQCSRRADFRTASIAIRTHFLDAVHARDSQEIACKLDDFLADCRWNEAITIWFGTGDEALTPSYILAMLSRDIAAIDALIGDQMDAILHHEELQHIEAAWRGLHYLLEAAREEDRIQVRLFSATWDEIARDFERASDFDRSTLFTKIYSDEYDMPGGMPYGLLLCDYTIAHRRSRGSAKPVDDIGTLSQMARVAAAAFAPCIIGAAPELFGVASLTELASTRNLDAGFVLPEYQRWQRLRRDEESRFLGVAAPRILLREPYDDSAAHNAGFVYRECVVEHDCWLWGNAVYAVGAMAIRAFRESGWFAELRGAKTNGVEEAAILPAPGFSTGEALARRRPVEVELTDKKQKVLEDLGFISLSPCSFSSNLTLLGIRSLYAAPAEDGVAERANARLSGALQYLLCVCRFAHYVKLLARDRMGRVATAAALERFLNDWLRGYTIGNPDAGPELRARHPLSNAAVQVREQPGSPGALHCVMHLQPHFQFEQLMTSFRLRTELKPAANR